MKEKLLAWDPFHKLFSITIQIRWNIHLSVFQLLVTKPIRNLAHAMRAQLLCYVHFFIAGKLSIIGSDNGLSLSQFQAISTAAGILLIEPLGTNFSEILIKSQFSIVENEIGKGSLENCGHFVSGSVCW